VHCRSNDLGVSAIYEDVMIYRAETCTTPPSLPSRTRKNTNCSSLKRSYTTTESEMVKKWSWFENVFGKSKRFEAKKREKKYPQPRELQKLKRKRNSFSSPDLSYLGINCDESFNASCSFNVEPSSSVTSSNSLELENLCEEFKNTLETQKNESCYINTNYKINAINDDSAVNLVGSSFNLDRDNTREASAQVPSDYLEMLPGRGFDLKQVKELDRHIKNDVLYSLKYSFDSPITYKREYENDVLLSRSITDSNEYVCMSEGKLSKKSSNSQKGEEPEEHTYITMKKPEYYSDNDLDIESKICTRKSLTERLSFDEKVCSYHPNVDKPFKLNVMSNQRNNRKKCSKEDSNSDTNGNNFTKKYATLSHVPDSVFPSTKRLNSFPRFKKIDFSPLRQKISSVLQKNK
jgi:hypothetical protein